MLQNEIIILNRGGRCKPYTDQKTAQIGVAPPPSRIIATLLILAIKNQRENSRLKRTKAVDFSASVAIVSGLPSIAKCPNQGVKAGPPILGEGRGEGFQML